MGDFQMRDTTTLENEQYRTHAFVANNGQELMKALGAPPMTRTITIRIPTEDVVTITYETLASERQLEALGQCFKAVPDG